MVINVDTNNKEQMKQLEEILAKYEQLEEQTKKIHFLTIKEFAEMRRMQFICCSKNFQPS